MLKLPRDIAQKAKNGNTGARELSNVINYMFDKILYDVMSKPKNTYKKCILSKGIEEENTRKERKQRNQKAFKKVTENFIKLRSREGE